MDIQKPYGEADQERYEDDGTDRKKKEGRREERKGVLRRVISSKISVSVSDCSYCHRIKTHMCSPNKVCLTQCCCLLITYKLRFNLRLKLSHQNKSCYFGSDCWMSSVSVKGKQYGLSDSLTSTLHSNFLSEHDWPLSLSPPVGFLFIIHTRAQRLVPHRQTHYSFPPTHKPSV